jgi:hypothetical protein
MSELFKEIIKKHGLSVGLLIVAVVFLWMDRDKILLSNEKMKANFEKRISVLEKRWVDCVESKIKRTYSENSEKTNTLKQSTFYFVIPSKEEGVFS